MLHSFVPAVLTYLMHSVIVEITELPWAKRLGTCPVCLQHLCVC